MSVQAKFTTAPSTYSVEEAFGCLVIHGAIPLSVVKQLGIEDATVCGQLARVMNATAVVGTETAINAAREKLGITMTPPARLHRMTTLQRLMEWHARGHVGDSSVVMFQAFLGNPHGHTARPHDVDDFLRCALLLRWAPELYSRLNELQPISAFWARLVESWRLLEMLLTKMNPTWASSNQGPSASDLDSEEARAINAILDDIAKSVGAAQ